MLERGLVDGGRDRGRQAAASRQAGGDGRCHPTVVAAMLHRGGPTEREAKALPVFAVGDRVRTRMIHPPTHTRLPRYVRGHVGIVELLHGVHVFPDTNSLGQERIRNGSTP